MSTDVQQMDLQGLLNSIASSPSPHSLIRSLRFGEAQRYLQSDPLHVRYPARVDMNGSRVTATHSHHGVVIGEDAKVYELELHHGGVEYHLSNVYSPGSGLRVIGCDRSTLSELQVGRFKTGFDFTPKDASSLQDLTLVNLRAAGCKTGLFIDNANVVKIIGLDVHGELNKETVEGSIGMHLRKIVSGVVLAPKIQSTERALVIDDCTGLSIQGLYTEHHGRGMSFNDTAVGVIHNSRNVCVHGLVNATNGSSSDPTHCKTGLRISGDCKAITIDCRSYMCRELEVELHDTDPAQVTIIGEGGSTFNPAFTPRVFRGASIQKEEIATGFLSGTDLKPSATISLQESGLHKLSLTSHDFQLPVKGYIDTEPHGISAGDQLEAEIDVRLLSYKPVGTSGQTVFRLTLGVPDDYESNDLPLSFTGEGDTLAVRWAVPDAVPEWIRFTLGSRPTSEAEPTFNLFTAEVSDVRIYKRMLT